MKKYLLSIFAIVAMMMGVATAHAQQTIGSWYHYPLYSGVPTKVVVTPDRAYYLMLNRLYSYAKDGSEFVDHIEELNSASITALSYNAAKQFMAVGFSDGNIDLLYDNGDRANLSDIRDAALGTTRQVNDFDFLGDDMFVATNFGVVQYDTKRHVVKQSGIYNKEVKSVATLGNRLFILIGGQLYNMGLSEPLARFDRFTAGSNPGGVEITRLGDERMLLRSANAVSVYQFDTATGTEVAKTIDQYKGVPFFSELSDGSKLFNSGNHLYSWSTTGSRTDLGALPAALNGHAVATYTGLSDLWAADGAGIAHYRLDGSNLTVLMDKALPLNATSVQRVAYIIPSPDKKSIYIGNSSDSNNPASYGNNVQKPAAVDRIRDNKVEPVNFLYDADGNLLGTNFTNLGVVAVAEDPDDPSIMYQASRQNGLFVVKDRKVIGRVNNHASLPKVWGNNIFNAINFDKEGNMWCVLFDTGLKASLQMLPAADRKGKQAEISKGTWQRENVTNLLGRYQGRIVFLPNTNYIFVNTAVNSPPLVRIDTKGTWGNVSDDAIVATNSYIDEDGKTFNDGSYNWSVRSVTEDLNGHIWAGCGSGLFVVTQPEKYGDADMRIRRPKVPRNDGTNYADYLLEGVDITNISVDGGNRKWISTNGSGVYLVSADGTEILEHFTTANSPLPTDVVNYVYADPLSNKVYVGTNSGLLVYSATYAPSAEDYSEIYAYPNPVRPGYTGWITVANLREDSLVKITDAQGNVVYQGRSEGGNFIWDGCNANGARVKSGVYYVMASTSGSNGSGSASATTKILILN